jgi:hydroxymethylpyrimidine pyrophosphatase-like HAD family hydrolase
MNGWIGVDLDGTLTVYDDCLGTSQIGEPVLAMLERVKKWLQRGIDVKIFTARASFKNPNRQKDIRVIKAWCAKHIGIELEVTAEKDYGMIQLWDDRCVQVITNTGEVVANL